MELTESRDRAIECMVDLIEYVRGGGDIEGIQELIESLDVPDGNYDDAAELLAISIFGTSVGLVRLALPEGSSEERIQTFVSVTSGVLEQVARIGRPYVEAIVDLLLGRGPALSNSYHEIAGYVAYCALLGPADRGELVRYLRSLREAAERDGKLGGKS